MAQLETQLKERRKPEYQLYRDTYSQSFVEWSVSEKGKIFGLQVGCGVSRKAYAFDYGKDCTKKPIIGSGLVLENGRLPMLELMDL
jgi:hypothetical protein